MTPEKIQEAEAGPLPGEQPPPAGLSSCPLEGHGQGPLEDLLPAQERNASHCIGNSRFTSVQTGRNPGYRWTGEMMVQSVQCRLRKLEDLSSEAQNPCKKKPRPGLGHLYLPQGCKWPDRPISELASQPVQPKLGERLCVKSWQVRPGNGGACL